MIIFVHCNYEQEMISIIVPCFNESEVIRETNDRINNVLSSHNLEFEIVYVNDGSRDDTINILTEVQANNSRIKIIDFSRNFGHQPAVSAGLAHCKGDYAVIIDADLQDPPSCIPDMLELAIKEKAAVVYGVRKIRQGETWFKKMTAKLFYRVMNYFSEYEIPVDTGDFRLINRQVISEFNQLKERQKYIRGLVSWLGFKQIPYYYNREERFAGETHYPFWKMVSFATKGLLYFSKKPLNIATNLGFVSVGLALLFLVVSFIQHAIDPTMFVTGWTSIICLVIFFGGIQLLTIGLLGSYIGNMFDEVKERPEYVVKNIIIS